RGPGLHSGGEPPRSTQASRLLPGAWQSRIDSHLRKGSSCLVKLGRSSWQLLVMSGRKANPDLRRTESPGQGATCSSAVDLHYAMKFENAPTMWGRFNYREIAAPEHMVWLNSFANTRCGIARAPFSENCPLEIQNLLIGSVQGRVQLRVG